MGSAQHGHKPSAREQQLTEEALQNWTVLAGSFPEETFQVQSALQPASAYMAGSAAHAARPHSGSVTPQQLGRRQQPQHHGQSGNTYAGQFFRSLPLPMRQTAPPFPLLLPLACTASCLLFMVPSSSTSHLMHKCSRCRLAWFCFGGGQIKAVLCQGRAGSIAGQVVPERSLHVSGHHAQSEHQAPSYEVGPTSLRSKRSSSSCCLI